MSRVVSPTSIIRYTECPKRLYFAKQVEGPTERVTSVSGKIIRSVVKDIYLATARKGRVPGWQYVIGSTERGYKEVAQGTTPEEVYREAKDILVRLHHWYTHTYPLAKTSGLINVPVNICLDDAITFKDTVELVTLGEGEVCLWDFSEQPIDAPQLFNDIEVQLRLWGFWKASDVIPKQFTRLIIRERSIQPVTIQVLESVLVRTERFVKHITRGMKDGIWYPVYSEKCLGCEWRGVCGY